MNYYCNVTKVTWVLSKLICGEDELDDEAKFLSEGDFGHQSTGESAWADNRSSTGRGFLKAAQKLGTQCWVITVKAECEQRL